MGRSIPRSPASPHPEWRRHLTRSLLNQLRESDIVTHIHTPAIGGIAGSVEVGRVADLTILDAVDDQFDFLDGSNIPFTGDRVIVPVLTIRRGAVAR
jgi:hypothetical protein